MYHWSGYCAYLDAGHDSSHEVGDEEVVPEVDEPRLNVLSWLVNRTGHEDTRTWRLCAYNTINISQTYTVTVQINVSKVEAECLLQ